MVRFEPESPGRNATHHADYLTSVYLYLLPGLNSRLSFCQTNKFQAAFKGKKIKEHFKNHRCEHSQAVSNALQQYCV